MRFLTTRRESVSFQRGFTLLEMSAAMSVLLLLSTAIAALIQQHVLFLQSAQKQNFLTSEAPQIGNLLIRILSASDYYFVYSTKESAEADQSPILGPGKAVKLYFFTPEQVTETRLLTIQTESGRASLRLYSDLVSYWTISTKIQDAVFTSENGLLAAQLLGPFQEQITYYGGTK